MDDDGWPSSVRARLRESPAIWITDELHSDTRSGAVESASVHTLHSISSVSRCAKASAEQLAARMPATAALDLMEWTPSKDLASYVNALVSKEVRVETLLNPGPCIRITGDHPYNEYYFLRHQAH